MEWTASNDKFNVLTERKGGEKMKLRNKTWKSVTITIERVVEEKVEGAVTSNRTLYYLLHARYPHGSAIGFRADSPIECWVKLMQEVNL